MTRRGTSATASATHPWHTACMLRASKPPRVMMLACTSALLSLIAADTISSDMRTSAGAWHVLHAHQAGHNPNGNGQGGARNVDSQTCQQYWFDVPAAAVCQCATTLEGASLEQLGCAPGSLPLQFFHYVSIASGVCKALDGQYQDADGCR